MSVSPRLRRVALAVIACSLALIPASRASAAAEPTVVLVHGAFADASSWQRVTARLQDDGVPVVAPANPLRGIAADAAYIRRFVQSIDGPVVLVGHSYGGTVITNAAAGLPNVRALVYVAAYAPDEGETIAGLSAAVPGGMIGPSTLDVRPFPGPDGTDTHEAYIKPELFRQIFAADLSRRKARILAVSQRPAALSLLGEPSGPPAWRFIPSYYAVAGADNAIGTKLERFMAHRIAPRRTIEIAGASHLVMLSRPRPITRLIETAAAAAR